MGNTATPISEVSEPKDDPKALIANEIETLLQKGKELQDSKHFEEAGEVYAIIAQLKEKQSVDYYGLTIMYQTSATCYFEAKSRKAIDSCERAIDAILNDGRIDLGIGHCFKYGHVIQLNLGDAEKKEELFNRGDQLRIQHNITHSCPVKKVEESEIRNDKQKVLQELKKFKIIRLDKGRKRLAGFDICRKCIGCYETILEHAFDGEPTYEKKMNYLKMINILNKN